MIFHLTISFLFDSYSLQGISQPKGVVIVTWIENRTNLIIQKLKSEGHRITPQRNAIVRTLVESRGHPSVEDIFGKVHARFPTTSLATFYKTISVIRELGEVLEPEFSNGLNRYDGNNPHPLRISCACAANASLTRN